MGKNWSKSWFICIKKLIQTLLLIIFAIITQQTFSLNQIFKISRILKKLNVCFHKLKRRWWYIWIPIVRKKHFAASIVSESFISKKINFDY